MDAKLYLYNEDKDTFSEITKVTSQDVVFVVINEEQKVLVWQGHDSNRMQRYKAAMKVATLISTKRLYNFKSEIVSEGEENAAIKEFIARKFGKRDLSQTEIARDDRKQVEAKAKEIAERFAKGEPAISRPKPATPASSTVPPVLEKRAAAMAEARAESRIDRPVVPTAPKKEDVKEKRENVSIQSELRRVNLGLGRDMASTENMSLEKKQFLSKDEKEILDEVRREQSRSDNIASVQETKLMDEERRQKLQEMEGEHRRQADASKRKSEHVERERIENEKDLLQEKLRKEKEELTQDRLKLEEKLKEEELGRKRGQEAQMREREVRKKDVVEFEMRKIDLRMQARRKGVDYIATPPAGSRILYRIEKGVAVKMEQEYLTMADVYLLDKGNEIFTWNGKLATLDERFFGDEIAKLLKEKRGEGAKITVVEQAKEPLDFISSFQSLMILDGNFAQSVLKKEQVASAKDFFFYRIKTEGGLLFMEMPKNHESITSDDSFLFDYGNLIIVWHGKGSNPEERARSSEIASMFAKERGQSVKIKDINEGIDPAYDQLPPQVWEILKGEAQANSLAGTYNKAMDALEKQRRERELKLQQEEETKRLADEKKSLEQMERIEREMLQKEIERKKLELTPQQIEEKWREFRRKLRVRRGLPEEEVPVKLDLKTGEPVKEVKVVPAAPAVDKVQLKKQREKEHDQLKRIELEMLEKRIAREKPAPDVEAKWRSDLKQKLNAQWNEIQEEFK
nr:hypothetical protein [Candidatus Sigynarchaeota archaeon]